MANQEQDQAIRLEQLATFVFEMARDMKYLLNRQQLIEVNPGQMGGRTTHPTAAERANEIQTTLAGLVQLFGKNLEDYSG